MSMSIDQAFVKQFEREVHIAYQRMGPKLRNTVRLRTGVKGSTCRFQKAGKGTAGAKSRHGLVPVMNVDHTYVDATLTDDYAGDWIDKLDELKINHNEREVIVRAAAGALGRKTDNKIIVAAEATTNTAAPVGATLSNGLHLADVLAIQAAFGLADIPDDGRRFAVIGPHQWSHLMQIPQFASADYISDRKFAEGVQVKNWLGFTWITMSYADGGLTNNGTDTTCLFYHQTGIGLASAQDISADIQYYNTNAAYFYQANQSSGAVLIDANSVYALAVKDALSS